ncbi:hypothetical protein E8E14_006082 [Neopestalotiopsis sp. 37M]|nr:hypothetical protein E8E14_006082 [Neopestalotiopsis sp. 37M]
MGSQGSSQNDWSLAGSYQSEDQSFSFGSAPKSEESSYFQVSSNRPNSDQLSVNTGPPPPHTATGGGSDGIHCTHGQCREHCVSNSRDDRDSERSSSSAAGHTPASSYAQEPDMSEFSSTEETPEHHNPSTSPAMERYLNDEQRHERIALGYSSF